MPTGQPGEYPVGSLVRIRERDWVVLPSDDDKILCLRPLSGSESETCGIHRDIEGQHVRHAEFAPPKPEQAGDFIAGKLLRNAARLGLRSGAGPFRSLGRLSVRPRPYQFVPLIMALKLDTVRMLIADDVGVGKTIEAAADVIVEHLQGWGRNFDVETVLQGHSVRICFAVHFFTVM